MKPSVLESSIGNFYLAQGYQLTSMQGCETRLQQLAKQQEKGIRDVESGLFQMQMVSSNWRKTSRFREDSFTELM
jgi:hypothetical protein